ncbi:AMP-binding protein, partial [Mycobacterium intermedium]|uniref:AMP-binding protein n=1 Tax=Mycobacterium intermedium TaxID=28445 RepID=UPI0021F36723
SGGEPAGIAGTVEFRTDVFDAASIEALLQRWERVLAAMVADAGQRLSAIDVLDPAERLRLDELGRRSVLTRPADTTGSVPVLFAAQVARTPEAVAVTFEGSSLSYRELDEASNRLAHLLVESGAGPGRFVALLLPRSAEAVVAMLGVLKAGAAYVPIDPAVPVARVGFVLADAAPVAVITTTELADRLADHNLPIINVADAQNHSAAGLTMPGPNDIAYLIYTSGTTGTPKGVAVTHHNLTQVLMGLSDVPRPGVWAQAHSLAFDASVEEIWAALLHGGRLVVVPESV